MIKPAKLEKGDTIAFIGPSSGLGGMFPHRVDKAKKSLESLGFNVKVFPTAKNNVKGKAGTVDERISDLHEAFTDNQIKAILCVIGGFSCNELITKIDYQIIKKNPKIFCGYSDITILHYSILKKTGLTTFYGPCAMTQFGEYPNSLDYTIQYFLKAVTRASPIGKVEPSKSWTDETLDWSKKLDTKRPRNLYQNEGFQWINAGKAKGKTIGGCLYSLLQLRGTEFDGNYKNKVFFIETPEGQEFGKGEPLNYIDAQLTDLKNSGVFDKIRGLIVGRPFGYKGKEKAFEEVIRDHTKDYSFPVLCNVNIGHADPIITLPLGVKVTLDSEKNLFSVDESGVKT